MGSMETFRQAWPHQKLPCVSYGLPYPEACAKHINDTFHASRIYILASKSLSRNGDYFQRLKDAIGEENIVGIKIGVTPHNPYSDCLELVRLWKDLNVDCIVTFGGGSLIDACKGAILAFANDVTEFDKMDELFRTALSTYLETGTAACKPSTLPMICITTTLSGGEFNGGGGCTNDKTHHKQLFSDPGFGPKLIIMDPALTVTTPEKIWLSTGVRAVDHCVESICSAKPSQEADEAAEEGLGLLVPGLLRCKKNPEDLDARLKCQLGVIASMKHLNLNPKVYPGASHGIGHQLGPFNVGHGVTSCILMTAVQKYNAKVNKNQQEKVSKIFWENNVVKEVLQRHGLKEGMVDLGDALDAIVRELGMPRTLAEVGVGRDKLDAIAKSSLGDHFSQTNPIPLKEKEQVLEILEACY